MWPTIIFIPIKWNHAKYGYKLFSLIKPKLIVLSAAELASFSHVSLAFPLYNRNRIIFTDNCCCVAGFLRRNVRASQRPVEKWAFFSPLENGDSNELTSTSYEIRTVQLAKWSIILTPNFIVRAYNGRQQKIKTFIKIKLLIFCGSYLMEALTSFAFAIEVK